MDSIGQAQSLLCFHAIGLAPIGANMTAWIWTRQHCIGQKSEKLSAFVLFNVRFPYRACRRPSLVPQEVAGVEFRVY